jgi:hypothetical protein
MNAGSPSPRKRIVRRAVMAVAVVLLLPMAYVSAWLSASRAIHNGIISAHCLVSNLGFVVFAPLMDYSGSDRPGSRQLFDLWWTINPIERRGSERYVMPSFALAPRDEQTKFQMLPKDQ